MFMLLKQHFHYKNIYTMEQLNTNLNENDGVKAIEIKGDSFFNLDSLLDKYYKRPESGSVNRTHISTVYNNKPGILELQDCINSPVCTQHLKKGDMDNNERKKNMLDDLNNLVPMKKPGLRPIKQIELGTKWRALVPEEYQNDVCPIPPRELVETFKRDKKNNAPNSTSNKKNKEDVIDPILKMNVKQLKKELEKLKLPKTGNKKDLI